jgi:hypothetical protein
MSKCRKCKREALIYRHLDNLCSRCYIKVKQLKPSLIPELGSSWEEPIEVKCPKCNLLACSLDTGHNYDRAECRECGTFSMNYEVNKWYKRNGRIARFAAPFSWRDTND